MLEGSNDNFATYGYELSKAIEALEKQYDKSSGEGDPSPLMDVVNTVFKKIEKNRKSIPNNVFQQLTRSKLTCQTRYNSLNNSPDENKSVEFYDEVLQFEYQSTRYSIAVRYDKGTFFRISTEGALFRISTEGALSEFPQKEPSSEFPQKEPSSDEVLGIEKVKKKAVVIGINEYQYLPNRILKGAQNDAAEVYTILQKNGFEISHEHYLQGNQASYRAISKAISDTLRKPTNYDIVVFYFSGHGFTDENNGGYRSSV